MKNILLGIALAYAATAWGGVATPQDNGFPRKAPLTAESGAAMKDTGPPGLQGQPKPERVPRWKLIRKYHSRPGATPPPGIPDPHYRVMPLVALALPVTLVLAAAAIAIVSMLTAHRTRVIRYQLIQSALKEGKELPPALWEDIQRRPDHLGGGLILIALGLGMSVAFGVTAGPSHVVWGLIPLLIGVALIVSAALRKRTERGPNK